MRTDITGSLIFEKETFPGSGIWTQKGVINA